PLIDPERVLMINGLFDFIIPRQATLRLHRALGRPKIIWFPTDHLYLYVFKKKIISYIKSFLR
ncbi:MAG: hypothetical protein P8Y62_07500, partial [candidate division WOR-3 bacterium]